MIFVNKEKCLHCNSGISDCPEEILSAAANGVPFMPPELCGGGNIACSREVTAYEPGWRVCRLTATMVVGEYVFRRGRAGLLSW